MNTFPVLATPEDDTVLGAAIVLPDHPQLAPQSRGNLFDGTEIEEALLLHVHALPDLEREAIAQQDPAVRAMVERAAATTPEDLLALHGVMTPAGSRGAGRAAPGEAERAAQAAGRPARTSRARTRSPWEGVTFRRGAKVRLRPRDEGDPIDHMVSGRTATIEKILYDVDDRLYFAVTVDGDPGQELLRDSGRFLYLLRRRGGARVKTTEPDTSGRPAQILVAGIGNAWLRDDGFGGHVAEEPRRSRTCPRACRCSTSAAAGSTWPTRSCAATTRSSWST